MQSALFLRALQRLPWLNSGRRSGAQATGPFSAAVDEHGDTALCAVALNAQRCAMVRLERRAGSARLHVAQAGTGSPDLLRQWKTQGWFSGAKTVLVLDPEQRHFQTLDRPEAPPQEWPLVARYPLADALEVDADTLLATATPMPRTNEALRPQMLGVAARLETVQDLLATLTTLGVQATHIDIADSALRGMVLLQGRADEGCIALAFVGSDICIGLIWQHQFCALRSLALPQLSARNEAESEEMLALHVQRTADHFERTATRLAVRSVLASMPSLTEETKRGVLAALPLASRDFDLEAALDLSPEAQRACRDDNLLTALACVAAARLMEPLAQRVAQEALEREARLEEEAALGVGAGAAAPTRPADISQAAIGQAALASLAQPRQQDPRQATNANPSGPKTRHRNDDSAAQPLTLEDRV